MGGIRTKDLCSRELLHCQVRLVIDVLYYFNK